MMFNSIYFLGPTAGIAYTSLRAKNSGFVHNSLRKCKGLLLRCISNIAIPKTKIRNIIQRKNIFNTSKTLALHISVYGLLVLLFIFAVFDFSSNQFQLVQEYQEARVFNISLGIDGLSIYFLLLITIIMPISLLSNWTSISHNVYWYLIIILMLDAFLLLVFLAIDALLFYIFFESILPPLFILIGLFGSDNRVRASFYLFLYTLAGSLFLLLSILAMFSAMGATNFDILYNINYNYYFQIILFCGIFIAFAVKTPTIFLNIWLLKAHVESPLSGSIILAAIVLKLSLYGILRLVLPLLPKAYINYTYFVYIIAVITILYASVSTLRTIDVKELIAYSSVSHAAVYLMGVFSNTIKGIEGGIILGLAHGFVSSGLFICVGGILYDRSFTRLITYYRGVAQIMPIFCIMFFILCLGNCGTPLTLNFIGEFLSLYGAFERLPMLGVMASFSIVFSAAYTIYLYNRISFAGSYSKHFFANMPDVNKREFYMLLILTVLTVTLGIYPNIILDGIHYSTTTLIYDSPASLMILPTIYINNTIKKKSMTKKFLRYLLQTTLFILTVIVLFPYVQALLVVYRDLVAMCEYMLLLYFMPFVDSPDYGFISEVLWNPHVFAM